MSPATHREWLVLLGLAIDAAETSPTSALDLRTAAGATFASRAFCARLPLLWDFAWDLCWSMMRNGEANLRVHPPALPIPRSPSVSPWP
jgi:hypothetical protein